MATVRLIVVLLVGGLVVLLGVQNLALALPLVFFGGSSQALPLGVWLVGAIALGALTTLFSTALLGAGGGGTANRSGAYKYRPQSFYEPTDPSAGARSAAGDSETRANVPPPYPPPGPRTGGQARPRGDAPAGGDPSWHAWTSLKSPGQWNDWESLSQAPKPETAGSSTDGPSGGSSVSGLVDGVTTWFSSSKQRAKQQQRVNESLRELDDWGDAENRPYVVPGVSPVQDSLDDISQGWDQSDPNRSFESAQAPRRVYRDGSIYSYSYRGEDGPDPNDGQVDNIYAPPDDAYVDDPSMDDAIGAYEIGDRYPDSAQNNYDDEGYERGQGPEGNYGREPDRSDYGDRPIFDDDFDDDDAPLGEPEVAEDGVVDADYRVIEAPYAAAAEAAAVTWVETPSDETDDDWDEADDALTP